MRFDAGSTDIPTAGSAVQISNTSDRVKSISVQGDRDNTGNVYFGVSDVSATNGWEMAPGEDKTVNFGEGSVLFSKFYVDAATNGDDVNWSVILA